MMVTAITMALGGLGLLLLGMNMMTEGLKAAAGASLQEYLERSTRTRFRAALSGFSLTALVQSSSAVIMTTLGFTNAGMLRLRQAAWVVFGSNVGTTMTAWIVALIGLRIRIDLIALPMIGLGALLRLVFGGRRAAHIGTALAGFGILFLGLDMLRDAFDGIAANIPVEQLGAFGGWGIVLGVLVGALLTTLVQSSSAALAIVLTAAVAGVFTPLLGAALVIGANVGTTSTSLLASIGATANARRLAWVHVAQKSFTGVIALILLWPLWWITEWLAGGEAHSNISTELAIFHTLFNVLGVLLMYFWADRLLRRVERWIPQPELSSEKPRYLDETVLKVPAMGVNAMHSELKRVFKQLLSRGRRSLLLDTSTPEPEQYINTSVLMNRISAFSTRLGEQESLAQVSESYLNLNWALQEARELRTRLHELDEVPTSERRTALNTELTALLEPAFMSGQLKTMSQLERDRLLTDLRTLRQSRRRELLAAIDTGELEPAAVTRQLQVIAMFEESAKHVLRIANVIYPAPV